MATIKIIETQIVEIDGTPTFRHADITISDEVDTYLWGVGGLPLAGDLQTILDARFNELWTAASAVGDSVPAEVTAKQEAKQFMIDNPNARLLIELSLPELETAIETRTAAQETLLLKTLAVAVRYLYEQGRLK